MDEILKVEHLEKSLGEFQLKDICLKLEPGYIMGLIGVNGTGKTSLINTVLNLYKKDGGRVSVSGYPMEEKEREAKDRIGFILERNLFEESYSVIRNAKMFGSMYSRFDESLFRTFCEKFEIPLKKKLGALSTGYQVRFQLAFALSHNAELFVLDEPAAGLDPLFRKELMRYLQEIVEDGTRSVLISTHITEDLDQTGDYIVLLKDGRIVLNQSIEEIKDRYILLYGRREEIEKLEYRTVIYREYGEYQSYAFVRREAGEDYGSYTAKQPMLEDIMYCLEKGGYEYA